MTKRKTNPCATCNGLPEIRYRNELARPFAYACEPCGKRTETTASVVEAINLWNHANPVQDLFGAVDA
jgi:hypothetical protein